VSLRVYAFTCGHLTGELGHLMEGGEGKIRLPIPAYLIEHPKGTALFDTGMHPDCQHDPATRLGARLTSLFEFDYKPGEEISARLAALGRDPAKIDLVINSHFHFDHVGGNALIPNATMLVQRREWDAGMDPDSAAKRGFDPRDFDLGHKLRLIDGEHDVFGDGSVLLIPTYGHTPGHQSLLVRRGRDQQLLFTADACYTRENMDRDILPTVVWDEREMSHSLGRLRDLRDKQGATTVYGHDPAQWRTLAQAPAPMV
jgi:glyoxylase-like metal-dependent hydrolase (beta-lactamase superfamily II)